MATATAAVIRIEGSNGMLRLPRRWLGLFPEAVVHGGPFRHAPDGMSGVCLLEQAHGLLERDLDLHLPIQDFSTPSDDAAVAEALKHLFAQLLRDRPVYVGCAGGWGRTGLFLALVAKVAGEARPVAFVRQRYSPRAIETAEQEAYVESFDVVSLQKWLRWAAVKHLPYRLI